MRDGFIKVNAKDGQPKRCKFCGAEVWYHQLKGRWYDAGGQTLHVENCEESKTHHRHLALERHEARRQAMRRAQGM